MCAPFGTCRACPIPTREQPGRLSYECLKCGHTECEVGEIRTAGGILSKLFDVDRERFSTVTCRRCSYTELYKGERGLLGDIFDFFTT